MDEVARMIALQDRAIDRHEAALLEIAAKVSDAKTETAIITRSVELLKEQVSELQQQQKEDERLKAKLYGAILVLSPLAAYAVDAIKAAL